MKGKMMKHDTIDSSITKEAITYAFAHCEAKLSEIARNLEQSESELREWVGILLLTKGTGTFDSLSSLRGHSSQVHKTVRKMEMAGDTHQYKTQKRNDQSSSGKKVIDKRHARKGFKYNGTHWMQKPENKARVAKLARARVAKMAA